jgi:NADP-dependent 3-hydroxy acid dehydrogenase YdfG
VVVGARRTETAASLVATYGDRVIPLRVDVSESGAMPTIHR